MNPSLFINYIYGIIGLGVKIITKDEREKLYNEVWTSPMTAVAARLGISDVALKKRCVKAEIPTPPNGYWAKLRAGKDVQQLALPKTKAEIQEFEAKIKEFETGILKIVEDCAKKINIRKPTGKEGNTLSSHTIQTAKKEYVFMPNLEKEVITVREAAARLGRGKLVVEKMLKEGTLPFGTAYKKDCGEYIYIIPKKAFERYMNGDFRNNVCPHCGNEE